MFTIPNLPRAQPKHSRAVPAHVPDLPQQISIPLSRIPNHTHVHVHVHVVNIQKYRKANGKETDRMPPSTPDASPRTYKIVPSPSPNTHRHSHPCPIYPAMSCQLHSPNPNPARLFGPLSTHRTPHKPLHLTEPSMAEPQTTPARIEEPQTPPSYEPAQPGLRYLFLGTIYWLLSPSLTT